VSEGEEQTLGGADAQRLVGIAQTGVLPDSDDDPVPWDAPWVETFDRWSHAEPAQGCLILLFSQTPHLLSAGYQATRHVLFAQGPVAPGPGLYVVGRASTTNAWKLALPTDFDAACAAIHMDDALRNLPTVVIGKKKRRMFYFPTGIGDDANTPAEYLLDRSETGLDWSKLLAELKVFETECLNTMEMMPKVWASQTHWYPIEEAELVIHSYLLVALRMVFRGYTTLSETNVVLGRSDLVLLSRDPKVPTRAVVELKVLRTYSYTGETSYVTKDWEKILDNGMIQAASYAAQTGAGIKVLCAYDMRKTKSREVFDACLEKCKTGGIELCDFPVHNNSAAIRVALNAASTKQQ
jgi:hypothetical protein